MMPIAEIISPWRGSSKSAEDVREQLREKFGDECADSFDPVHDAMPYSSWLAAGYQVKKAQKALKSITILETKDENGEVKKIRRTVNLFHKLQVQPI